MSEDDFAAKFWAEMAEIQAAETRRTPPANEPSIADRSAFTEDFLARWDAASGWLPTDGGADFWAAVVDRLYRAGLTSEDLDEIIAESMRTAWGTFTQVAGERVGHEQQ